MYDNSSAEGPIDENEERIKPHKKIEIKKIGGVILKKDSFIDGEMQSVESCEFDENEHIESVSIHNSGYTAVNISSNKRFSQMSQSAKA